jgi:hypothetical protein
MVNDHGKRFCLKTIQQRRIRRQLLRLRCVVHYLNSILQADISRLQSEVTVACVHCWQVINTLLLRDTVHDEESDLVAVSQQLDSLAPFILHSASQHVMQQFYTYERNILKMETKLN